MVHEVGSLSLWFAALESNDAYPSVEELIAKARAPVKREYLRQSGTRVLANTVVMTEETMAKLREEEGDDAEMMPSGNSIPKTSVEKKSKRQQRRDRKEVTSSWAPSIHATVL
jgi:Trk K+ transport system NAD-binding subunit